METLIASSSTAAWRAGGGGRVGGKGCMMLVSSASASMGGSSKPAVQRISADELTRLLPWSGCGARLAKEVGSLQACSVRVAASLVACALTYGNSIELASVVGFYWAWAPICGTLLPNLLLRLRYRYAGVWSAQVLRVQTVPPQKYEGEDRSVGVAESLFSSWPTTRAMLRLEIGDGSAATLTMEVPLTDDVAEVRVGERVELMVVSDKPSLSRFKGLHDVYFPERRIWISEEPSTERKPFERRSRKSLSRVSRGTGSEQLRLAGSKQKYLPSEDSWSRAKRTVDWEEALEEDAPEISLDRDFVLEIQEKPRERRKVLKEIDDADLYL